MGYHSEVEEQWKTYSVFKQMANIGAEVGRTIKWKEKGKDQIAMNAFYRALELIDLTIADPKNVQSLKELTRIREVFADHVVGDNQYHSSAENWDRYFYHFTIGARRE